MPVGDKEQNRREITLPDWLGSGEDFFGTIQIIKGKKINEGFLEIDFDFKFSEKFNYPIIFEIKSNNSDIEAYAIAFHIDRNIGSAQKSIEENIIAREVCSLLNRQDFIEFFADVIEKGIDFALYINKFPQKFKGMKLYNLTQDQRIRLDEHLVMEITEVLDRRNN